MKVAKVHAIGRLGGKHTNYVLSTQDLVQASLQLKGHHELMEAAGAGQKKPTLDAVFDQKGQKWAETALGLTSLEREGNKLGDLVVSEES